MKKIIIYSFFIFLIKVAVSQELNTDKVYSENLKSTLIHIDGDELSFPVIDLKRSQALTFTFDDLEGDVKSYTYTIKHCTSNWVVSDLYQTDYIDGYYDERVNDYQSSFNTLINYTHYTITIPNEYLKPKLSGNYILEIFNSDNPEKPIIIKRFMIVDYKVSTELKVNSLSQPGYFFSDQELEIKLDFTGSNLLNTVQNTKIVILKNHDWNQQISISKPDIIRNEEIIYNNYNILKFKGGNEFHTFNTKHIRNTIGNIMSVDFIDDLYHFQLFPNSDRTFKEYLYEPDINGRFKIDADNVNEPATEADYVYVYFTLQMEAPVQSGEIYVYGALTNYNFTSENKMAYNFEHKVYERRLLLKQGFYDYQYVLIENNKPDFTFIEGNHSQTENTYTILVYYHDYRGNYDQLIGVSEISSVIK